MTNSKNSANAFRHSVDARLSGLTADAAARASILRRAQEKENPVMKRKISVSLALALIAVLALAATACAAALRFGVMDYNSYRQDNEAFIEHIVSVDQTYENDYLTLHVNEAVFDGSHLSMTMEIEPKEGASEVYVIPRITARSGERELEVDIDGCRGGDFFSGFFVPGREEYSLDPGFYGVDAAIIRDEEDAVVYDVENEAVTWTVTFHVLKPEYEVVADETILTGDDSDDPPMEDYMQRFRDAYEHEQILLAYGYSVVEYESILPRVEGRSEDVLTASGAFSRADTIVARFETGENGAKSIREPQVFELGDYECTVTTLSTTFANGDYRLEVRKKEGGKNAAQEYVDGEGHWEFAVLVPGRTTIPMTDGCGVDGNAPDGVGEAVYYSGTFTVNGEADAVTFVPVWNDAPNAGVSDTRAVWNAQKPLTQEQEALAFTVELE